MPFFFYRMHAFSIDIRHSDVFRANTNTDIKWKKERDTRTEDSQRIPGILWLNLCQYYESIIRFSSILHSSKMYI